MKGILGAIILATMATFARGERVLVIGDSITGQAENNARGYAKQIREALALDGRTNALEVVCLGGSGQTTASWLEVVRASQQKKPMFLDVPGIDVARELDRGGDSLVIFLGMNDVLSCSVDFGTLNNVRTNLNTLIAALRQRTTFKRLYLATPTFCTEDPTDYRNRLLDAFAKIDCEIAAANQAALIPLRENYRRWWKAGRMTDADGFRITQDYVHPNEAGHFAIAESFLNAFGEVSAARAYARANAARLFGSSIDDNKPGFLLAIEQGSQPLVLSGEANLAIRAVEADVRASAKVTGQTFRLTLYNDWPADRQTPVRVTVTFADGSRASRVLSVQAPWRIACGFQQDANGYGYWHPQEGFRTNVAETTAIDGALLAGKSFAAVCPKSLMYYPTADHSGYGEIGAIDFCALTGGKLLEACYAARPLECPVDGLVRFKISSRSFAGGVKAVLFVDGKNVGCCVLGWPNGANVHNFQLFLRKGKHECVVKAVHATWQFALAVEAEQAVSGTAEPGDRRATVLPDADGGWEINDWQTAETEKPGEARFRLAFLSSLSNATVVTYQNQKLAFHPIPSGSPTNSWDEALPLRLVQKAGEGCSAAGSQWQFGSGRATYRAKIDFATVLPFQAVNLAPEAGVSVSSRGEPQSGFRPKGWVNKPETLTDGFIDDSENFASAERKSPLSADAPEWIQLTWPREQSLRMLGILRGRDDAGLGNVRLEAYGGNGDPQYDRSGWRELQGTWSSPKRFRAFSLFDCGRAIRTSAVRLTCTGGITRIGLGEILALGEGIRPAASDNLGKAPIVFNTPDEGKVTIQIRDSQGNVVANPLAGVAYPAGRHTLDWDLTDLNGRLVTQPGDYTWRGIWTPELRVEYNYTYYPFPLSHVAWQTPDRKGGWLADHEPPRTICRIGRTMWLGAFAEMGDSILEADSDGNKLWGIDRLWVAVPTEICCGDDGLYYGFCAGGWIGDSYAILQIDPQTKENRRVFFQENVSGSKNGFASLTDKSVSGFQVIGNRAFVSFKGHDKIIVYDLTKGLAAAREQFSWEIYQKSNEALKPVVIREITLPSPGRLRRYGPDKLVTTSGRDIVTIDAADFKIKTLIAGAVSNPLGLGTDGHGNLFIGEGAPLHQVFGFKPDGTKFLTLGKPGQRKIGAFDPDDLEEPFGVEVAADGRIWVAEHTDWTRRVSIWNPKTATCDKAVYGPTQYGGDGCLDPADETRLFYKGMEFRRDPASGRVTPVAMNFRPDNGFASFPRQANKPDDGNYPTYAFRANGRLWFTSYGYPHGHPVLVLWAYTNSIVKPAAAIGSSLALRHTFGEPLPPEGKPDNRDCAFLAKHLPGAKPTDALFAWTDLNGDGNIQTNELQVGGIDCQGKPVTGASALWNWRMNGSFVAAANADGLADRMLFFKPRGFTAIGYPLYSLPTETFEGSGMGLMPDGSGNAVVLGKPIRSISPEGKTRWIYRNDWPGLHGGHKTTARGDEPGVLIAPTRMWGAVPSGGAAGEVIAFNSNLGCSYLMTADDGLFIDRIFADQRVGLLWNSPVSPRPDVLKQTSLYDEHFGGLIQTTVGKDGKRKIVYVVGKNHCSVVELEGLDRIQRLTGGTVAVTPAMLTEALARQTRQASLSNPPKRYSVRHVAEGSIQIDGRANEWPPERIDGFALAYDHKNLYVLYQGRDENEAFQNRGANPLELFKTGDVLDVMLATNPQADPRRETGGAGDIRLSFSMFNGKPVGVLYEAKVPGHAGDRVPFSSPWRTVWFDRAGILDSAKIAVVRNGHEVTVEACVPWSALRANPAALVRTRGDVGVIAGDATSTRALSRVYWSNKNTAIMSDLPSEADLQPRLWGEFEFAR